MERKSGGRLSYLSDCTLLAGLLPATNRQHLIPKRIRFKSFRNELAYEQRRKTRCQTPESCGSDIRNVPETVLGLGLSRCENQTGLDACQARSSPGSHKCRDRNHFVTVLSSKIVVTCPEPSEAEELYPLVYNFQAQSEFYTRVLYTEHVGVNRISAKMPANPCKIQIYTATDDLYTAYRKKECP